MVALLTGLIWIALYILFIGFLGIAAEIEMGLHCADWCAEHDPTEP